MKELQREVKRRRTFGIISHPDAGKTTLTEKLLLFGGAIRMAGAVQSKKSMHATSDWMAVERERGISVTSSVMKFDYEGYKINILDTPGHKDFSEDTYRVLTAVDSVIMVIDSAKGVEEQTKKLMEICRMRSTPIMTFINKMDRAGRHPLELLDDIEHSLGIEAVPLTWPIGEGHGFKGVYDLRKSELRFFVPDGMKSTLPKETVLIRDIADPLLDKLVGSEGADALRHDVALLEGAGYPFEVGGYLKSTQTPVFFGSALNNFGVRELLDTFVFLAPPPQPRATESHMVSPLEEEFTGMVFKTQANMDPAHRDRIAFLRICSGTFVRGIKVRHHRLGKDIQINNATFFMAQDREGVDKAWPGDIIGIQNHGTIKIGDTFSTSRDPLKFTGIPNFAPEHFRRVRLLEPLRSKQLEKGLKQLSEEGAIQVFKPERSTGYLLGAVGPLQFDVTMQRLKDEYNVDATYEHMDICSVRWIAGGSDAPRFLDRYANDIARDIDGDKVFLVNSMWRLEHIQEQFPDLELQPLKEHR